jgi:hypothetical protein
LRVSCNWAPLDGALLILRLSGVRIGRNPVTGETITLPNRTRMTIGSVSEIPAALLGLNDYDVRMAGQGPPALPPFRLRFLETDSGTATEADFKGEYGLEVACCLRAKPVATSDVEFGSEVRSTDREGVFRHPTNGQTIRVPNAGFARFWIQVEVGKWIFPRIDDSLEVLDPAIVACAARSFDGKFVQGCFWYD